MVPESVSGGRWSYLGIIISALFNFKRVNRITEIVQMYLNEKKNVYDIFMIKLGEYKMYIMLIFSTC